MKAIIVTGTPGTGKTTLARKLGKKLNFSYLDANKTIKKYKLVAGYDKKRKANIVDIKKLNRALIKEINNFKGTIKKNTIKRISLAKFNKIKLTNNMKNNNYIKKGIIIDSHLSHYLPKKYVDLCIVTKCDLKVLEKRLKEKKYDKNKIRENLDAEIFDICLNEAKENGHKIMCIDTTKGINITSLARKIGGFIGI